MAKKTIWYEVEETETISECLERMQKDGYMPAGRKEEPLFQMIEGKPVPIRQLIKFKGILMSNE
ncbi:NETI motif-containing protein [Kurthia senegalensis]|uniref:NETI motif-containing protein n=1 Tax=Kurthia senegalensis TaxID=1033740 RepID=UPI000289D4C5|nr:NETI motif-containing protein [Kurthia senegalensis]